MDKNDRELFVEQVREHHSSLRGFVRALGVDPLWVDDVAQEAFIIAYNRREEFDQSRDFGAWLRGIARNLVINERRKDARRKRILSDNLTDILLATSSLPEEEKEELADLGVAQISALRECIKELPEKSLELIRAKYENNVTALEIADSLGMKAPAVRKALERLRGSLRKCMERKVGMGRQELSS